METVVTEPNVHAAQALPQQRAINFYGVMGLVFAAVAIIGFAPNSLAILAGTKASPPLLIHFHAAAMSAWVGLLATQACLMSAGNAKAHAAMGVCAFFLSPVIFGLMVAIALPILLTPQAEPMFFLIQTKRLVVFGFSVGLALALRKKNSATHKRLMFLGTYAVLDAAFFRMDWFLPALGVEKWPAAAHVWQYLLLVPFVVHDLKERGGVHIVFLVGIPVIVVFQSAAVMFS